MWGNGPGPPSLQARPTGRAPTARVASRGPQITYDTVAAVACPPPPKGKGGITDCVQILGFAHSRQFLSITRNHRPGVNPRICSQPAICVTYLPGEGGVWEEWIEPLPSQRTPASERDSASVHRPSECEACKITIHGLRPHEVSKKSRYLNKTSDSYEKGPNLGPFS